MPRFAAFPSIRDQPLAPDPPVEMAAAPRPWLTRRDGECAFPVDGESWNTRSCCNPCGKSPYCHHHRALMRAPHREEV